MTEIPDHLLKRSRDRRKALGLGGGDDASGDDETKAAESSAAATPEKAAAAAPAAPSGPPARKPPAEPAAPPPPKPDPPYVAAAKRRAKIPFWAMAALSLMPIWIFMYVRAVTAPPEVAAGPMGIGAEIYGSSCSSCHGGDGTGGGAGRQLNEGEVLLTFPHIEDHLRFVYFGTQEYQLAGVDIYGSPDRPEGAHATGSLGLMPGWGPSIGGQLTDAEVLAVVCDERYGLPGSPAPDDEQWAEEYALWCAEDSPVFAALEGGASLTDLSAAGIDGVDGIGDAPVEGSA